MSGNSALRCPRLPCLSPSRLRMPGGNGVVAEARDAGWPGGEEAVHGSSKTPLVAAGDKTSLAGALRDEVIDLGFVEASWIDPDLLEEPLDLQADDPVHPGPGQKSDEQHPGVAW